MWAGLWIGLLFGLSIFTGQKKSTLGNKPLAAWLILTWVWVLWTFTQGIITSKQYNLQLLMSLLHILSIGLFYLAAKAFWNKQVIERLLNTIAISGGILILYGILQALNIDPIFKDLDALKKTHEIVGLIGNPSHFGIYLAVLLPVYWSRKHWTAYLAQAGIWGLLITLVIRNASVGGMLSAMAASLVWWLFKKRLIASFIGISVVLTLGYFFLHHARFHQLLTDSGRFQAWGIFSKLIGNSPMWGVGPGAISFISTTIKEGFLRGWRHCHNEYLQLLIEQGLAGLCLLAWLLYDTAQRVFRCAADPLVPALASIITAFAFSSLISYPAHLWMIGAIGLFAICAINVFSESDSC